MRHFTKVRAPCQEARTFEGRMCRLRGSKVRASKGGCRGFFREQPPHEKLQPYDAFHHVLISLHRKTIMPPIEERAVSDG
ncbi:MAG: hypothetical protein IJV44_01425 [Prevotella sp.]|nr:hypothetical protein [Prevotella sp.]